MPKWCVRNETVYFGKNNETSYNASVCRLQFYIPDDLAPPVLLYYQLTNFYQNHRRYVQSFDTDQLSGKFRSNQSIDGSDCDPLKTTTTTDAAGAQVTKAIYPCGLIANSLFNDTFSSPVLIQTSNSNANQETYPMTHQGIAWSSDKDLYGATEYKYGEVVPPPNWAIQYPVYNDSFPFPDLHTWEEFQVWMRTAGLPTFSKLALRNDNQTMQYGTYTLEIHDCKWAPFQCQSYLELVSMLIEIQTSLSRSTMARSQS